MSPIIKYKEGSASSLPVIIVENLQTTHQYEDPRDSFTATPTLSFWATATAIPILHAMLTTSLGWLAVLAPALSGASPVAIPEDLPALEKRIGNVGSFANYFPDCTDDPSYATGASQYNDGDGVYVTSSCDNGLTTPAVVRFHCW